MIVRRPFSDTHVSRGTVLRLATNPDGRTVEVRIEGPTHTLRRVDLVRMQRWIDAVLAK